MSFRFLHPVLFLPRAMIKGPKSSFVVVVVIVLHLVGSVESWAKNVLNGTKNVRKQICSKSKNKCYERNKKCSQWKLLQIKQKVANSKWQNHCFIFSLCQRLFYIHWTTNMVFQKFGYFSAMKYFGLILMNFTVCSKRRKLELG